MSVTIGFDTEAFAKNSRGEIVPMGGLIYGTKHEPFRLHSSGVFIQEDGVTVETNTPVKETPEAAHAALRETWHIALEWMRAFLPSKKGQEFRAQVGRKIHDPSNISIAYLSDHVFEMEKLQLAGPGAFMFGCDPDFDAYGYDDSANAPVANLPIDIGQIGGLRFAGGHVHFGYDTKLAPHHIVVQMLDMISVGVGLMNYESQRSQYYGKPGCYRIKPYGVEYRTPTTEALMGSNGLTFLKYAHALLRQPKKTWLMLYKKYYRDILAIPAREAGKAAKEFVGKDLNAIL